MGALGVWALAIGVADLIAPAGPGENRRWRMRLAMLALPVVAALACSGIGLSVAGSLGVVVVAMVSGGLWLWLWHAGVERTALASLATAFVVLLVAAGHWTLEDTPLARLFEGSPFVPNAPDLVAVVVGLALLLIATGNRIVRIVLSQVEQGLLGQEKHLKGGRVIGPLERLLIYGLGISGHLVAAGLVVAAKSLLRFSELRSHDAEGNGEDPPRAELMSEYLLVGSLLSWSLAFVAVGVGAAAVAG